jgi:hypothetical protein
MKGKIGLILTLALIGVVVVGTILLGVFKIDYSANMEMPVNSIQINKAANDDFIVVNKTSEDKTIFDEVIKFYNNSFKQSVLASVFSGNVGTKAIVEFRSGSYSSQLNNTSGHKLVIALTQSGVSLKETDGNKEYNISEIAMGVENKEGFNTVTIYGKIVGPTTSYVEIITKANVKSLYDYITELGN